MRKQVLFVQGGGEGVHDAWDIKLVRSLEGALGQGYTVFYPRMPNEADPQYPSWKATLRHELDKLDDGAVLIGHSLGGTVLIHALAEQWPKRTPGAIALVSAPFIGEGGWQLDEPASLADRTEPLPAHVPVFLYHGTADNIVPIEHQQLYAALIPQAQLRVLANRDHQLNHDLRDVARDIHALFSSR